MIFHAIGIRNQRQMISVVNVCTSTIYIYTYTELKEQKYRIASHNSTNSFL